MDAWTDERLDDLAAALRPLPEQMARSTEAIERMSGLQRQFAVLGWTMAFTLIGAVAAVIIGT